MDEHARDQEIQRMGEQLVSAAEDSELREQLTYHAPHGDQPQRYEAIRNAAYSFASVILRTVPKCADRTTAIRKVREAVMTANAGIAISEALPDPVGTSDR